MAQTESTSTPANHLAPVIHHCSKGTGLAVRADNYHAIPLCSIHHRQGCHGVAVHAGRKTWEQKYGTEAELLAQINAELGVQE